MVISVSVQITMKLTDLAADVIRLLVFLCRYMPSLNGFALERLVCINKHWSRGQAAKVAQMGSLVY